MQRLSFRGLIWAVLLLAACSPGAPAYAQSWAEHWFDNVTYTSPGSFEDQARGYVTAGGFSGRVDTAGVLIDRDGTLAGVPGGARGSLPGLPGCLPSTFKNVRAVSPFLAVEVS